MGVFRYRIELGAIGGTHFETIEALVDTGATYTWIPRPVLEHLGITPTIKRRVKLADGKVIEREGTQIFVRLDGETLSTICLFGDEGSEPLLGAVTLEEFGLGVDPISRQLVPVIAFLM